MTIVPTYTAQIYIGGDHALAKQVCREHCMDVGLCVTVEPLEFVYTGGCEAGVRVGLINYGRFPSTPEAIFERAAALADRLLSALCQHSYSIVATDKTVFVSRREAA